MILRFAILIVLAVVLPSAGWADKSSSHHSAVQELIVALKLEEQFLTVLPRHDRHPNSGKPTAGRLSGDDAGVDGSVSGLGGL